MSGSEFFGARPRVRRFLNFLGCVHERFRNCEDGGSRVHVEFEDVLKISAASMRDSWRPKSATPSGMTTDIRDSFGYGDRW